MARLFSVVCLLALVLGAVVPAARAQEDDDSDDNVEVHEEEVGGKVQEVEAEEDDAADEEEPAATPHPAVSISHVFPVNLGRRFPAGEKVELLFGFENNAEADFNVTSISAHLVVPQDYFYYVENYTSFNYNTIVSAGETQTFEYAFIPDETFDPREFGFTALINYVDAEGREFQSAIYNGTVDIVEPSDFTDTTTFFTYVAVSLVAALAAFIAYRLSTGTKKSKSVRRAPIETGTSKTLTSQELEYLEGIIPSSTPKEKKKKSSTGAKASGKRGSGKR
jgi:translocon-associated protein subunit alpha